MSRNLLDSAGQGLGLGCGSVFGVLAAIVAVVCGAMYALESADAHRRAAREAAQQAAADEARKKALDAAPEKPAPPVLAPEPVVLRPRRETPLPWQDVPPAPAAAPAYTILSDTMSDAGRIVRLRIQAAATEAELAALGKRAGEDLTAHIYLPGMEPPAPAWAVVSVEAGNVRVRIFPSRAPR